MMLWKSKHGNTDVRENEIFGCKKINNTNISKYCLWLTDGNKVHLRNSITRTRISFVPKKNNLETLYIHFEKFEQGFISYTRIIRQVVICVMSLTHTTKQNGYDT
jgi:hypothetical protein